MIGAADRRVRLAPAPMLALLAVFATLPWWVEAVGLYPYLGVEIMIWIVFALGFNLLLGTSGLPSFGHGAYFGIGAYAFGLAQFHLHPSLWLCLAAAVSAGALAGALVACFVAHRRGIYFALLTIAFGQIFWFVAATLRRNLGRVLNKRLVVWAKSDRFISSCGAGRETAEARGCREVRVGEM